MRKNSNRHIGEMVGKTTSGLPGQIIGEMSKTEKKRKGYFKGTVYRVRFANGTTANIPDYMINSPAIGHDDAGIVIERD